MEITNHYDDIYMVLSDLSKNDIAYFVEGCEFALIKIEKIVIDNDWRRKYHPKYIVSGRYFDRCVLQIDEGNETHSITYLCIKDKLPPYFKQMPGVYIMYPSVDELYRIVLGKRLIFYPSFIEKCCGVDGVESIVNTILQKEVFHLRKQGEYYLVDKLFDIEIFLQRIHCEKACNSEFSKPEDVRSLDINAKILSKLKEESSLFYNDTVAFEYAAASDRILAQYFLSKFHSNRRWSLDPVCILNFRISSYVLPTCIMEEEAYDIPNEKIVYDTQNGSTFVLNSIEMDNKSFSSLFDFFDYIERIYTDIALA